MESLEIGDALVVLKTRFMILSSLIDKVGPVLKRQIACFGIEIVAKSIVFGCARLKAIP